MVSPIRHPSATMPEAQQCLGGCVNGAGLIGLSIYLPEGHGHHLLSVLGGPERTISI